MGRTSILVVDDSVVIRQVLAQALSGRGYTVCSVRDGQEAMDWIARNPPADVIITDLHMPHIDGVGLIRRIRALRDYRQKPIFVLTAAEHFDEKDDARQAGATAWIIKPFVTDKLVDAIERVVH